MDRMARVIRAGLFVGGLVLVYGVAFAVDWRLGFLAAGVSWVAISLEMTR